MDLHPVTASCPKTAQKPLEESCGEYSDTHGNARTEGRGIVLQSKGVPSDNQATRKRYCRRRVSVLPIGLCWPGGPHCLPGRNDRYVMQVSIDTRSSPRVVTVSIREVDCG